MPIGYSSQALCGWSSLPARTRRPPQALLVTLRDALPPGPHRVGNSPFLMEAEK